MSSLWHRVAADPGLAAAVRAAAGDDALDLLWWAEHPGEPTPAGAPDPATRLERERRAFYRPGGGGDPGAVADAAARHAARLARAVSAARAASVVEDADELASPQPDPVAGDPLRTSGRRGLLVTVVAAGAALVLGVVVGALATGDGGAPAEHAAIQAFQVFDRRQVASVDLPAEALAVPIVRRSTIRRLRFDPSIGTTLFAARADGGRVCVFVVVLATASPPACTSPAAFAIGGLTLLVRATADPTDDSGRRPVDELVLTWSASGVIAITPDEVGTTSAGPNPTATGS